jgi:hypothetical protein
MSVVTGRNVAVLYGVPAAAKTLTIGKTADWRRLSVIPITAVGDFRVALPSAQEIAGLADTSGFVDFRLMARTSSGLAVDSFSADYQSKTSGAPSLPELASGSTFDLHLVRAHLNKGPLVASPFDDPGSCTTTAAGSYSFNGVVGATLVNVSSVSANFLYVNGSSSTLGSGVSASGAAGSFSASGTDTVSHTKTTTYSTYAHAQSIEWLTNFEYSKDKVVCTQKGSGTTTDYEANPASQNGGTSSINVGYPTLNYCESYIAGTGIIDDSGSAHNFSGGVNAGSSLGINLSSQTGLTKDASLTYNSNTVPFRVCGENNYPAQSNAGNIGATTP